MNAKNRSVSSVTTALSCSALLAGAVLFSGCEIDGLQDEAGAGDNAELRAANCKIDWGCTGNSPIVGNFGMHELSLDHLVDPATGLYFKSFRKGAKTYELDSNGRQIYARDPISKAIVLKHQDLEGGKIILRSKDPALADQEFELGIVSVNSAGAEFWRGPANAVETYRITYHIASISSPRDRRGPFELCPNPNPSSDPDAGKMGIYDTVIFGGDRYIAATKTVLEDAAADGRWLNIGCAGGVLAKLFLQRHAPPAFSPGIAPEWESRQTLLNLYSANYCGTGKAFTFAGEPLAFATAAEGSASLPASIASYEALWGPDGATCLEVPRLQNSMNVWPGASLFADITAECGAKLPLCSSLPGWALPDKPFGSSLMLSANPSGS
jgi:hypothetical protein